MGDVDQLQLQFSLYCGALSDTSTATTTNNVVPHYVVGYHNGHHQRQLNQLLWCCQKYIYSTKTILLSPGALPYRTALTKNRSDTDE